MNINNISNIFEKENDLIIKNVNYNLVCKNLPTSIRSMYIEYNNIKMIILNENLSLAEAYFYTLATSFFSIQYDGPKKITSDLSTQNEKDAIEYAKYYALKLCDSLS